jgi:NADPH:quinone reductase-like Zn-dependent oxidoreductase
MKIAMRDRWGGPEVMELREAETPVPTGNQVLNEGRNQGKVVITV